MPEYGYNSPEVDAYISQPGPEPQVICEDYAGHEWAPAGGGLLICMRCEAEKWEDE